MTKMQDIYKKALRQARQKVFENPKYEKIILFCKYKLNHGVFKRVETTKYFKQKFIPVEVGNTRVDLESLPAQTFREYLKSKEEAKKTEYKTEFIFNK